MKVEFTFDKTAVAQRGYTLDGVYDAIKREFGRRNLSCISDGDILAFEDNGGKDDYSNMLVLMMGLTRADWFLSIATSCIWHESEGKQEDILGQVDRRKHA